MGVQQGVVAMPLLLYGTAFKKGETGKLTAQALASGFDALDTANYTSYNEPLTGDAIADALNSGVERSTLFIQTKFTPAWVYDKDKIPFDATLPIEAQIRSSVQQSLDHLKTDYLDALLLHAPFHSDADTLAAWDVLETFVPHTVRAIGVSNFALPQLRMVYEHAAHFKPAIVQNCFYRDTGYDIKLRSFCKAYGITYQAYHMLRENAEILASPVLSKVAARLRVEPELAFYVLILALGGIQIINGTTKAERMVQDLKTVNDVFGKRDPGLLDELQPDIATFRDLLADLAKSK